MDFPVIIWQAGVQLEEPLKTSTHLRHPGWLLPHFLFTLSFLCLFPPLSPLSETSFSQTQEKLAVLKGLLGLSHQNRLHSPIFSLLA